jgi:hypothetical protein
MHYTAIVSWVILGLLCMALAKKKGKEPIMALAMGLLFGIFAVVYYLVAHGSREYELKKAKEKLEKAKQLKE